MAKIKEEITNLLKDLLLSFALIINLFLVNLVLILLFKALIYLISIIFSENNFPPDDWSKKHRDSLITIFFVCLLAQFIYFSIVILFKQLSTGTSAITTEQSEHPANSPLFKTQKFLAIFIEQSDQTQPPPEVLTDTTTKTETKREDEQKSPQYKK
jgi:hypothetical protein